MRFLAVPCLLLVWTIFILPSVACATNVDITADKIVRDAKDVATATGNVKIKRDDETLNADSARFDSVNHRFKAKGHVHIQSPKAIIDARSADMDTVSKQGILHEATVILPGGEHISANQLERVDDFTYEAIGVTYTTCPTDHQAWTICASKATVDQRSGTFTATNARFELGGIPVFYTPYWRHGTRRTSGLLTPSIASGKRRGTEIALPVYIAPDPDWDITLTPRWMSARGFMSEIEARHVSTIGRETVQFEGLYDKVLGRTRGRLRGKSAWRLPYDMNLAIDADQVSEKDYLADFSSGVKTASKRFLSSRAVLSQQQKYGNWILSAQHQQDLTKTSNDTTLNILPRFESGFTFPVLNRLAFLHLSQETTRFDRRKGLDGWRMNLRPYIEIPLSLAGGALSTTLQAGVRHARYWLNDSATLRRPTRTSREFSIQTRAIFERINADKTLRHSIEPTLRYDLVTVSKQVGVPTFDSAFSQLTLNNLLSSNRFSGRDRIPRANRVSFLLTSRLQRKDDPQSSAREVLRVQAGVSYDIPKRTAFATPQRPFSNVVGNITINPTSSLNLSANGQYDPAKRFFDTASTALNWTPNAGYEFHIGYRVTDARYSLEAQTINVSGKLKIGSHWHTFGTWNYNTLLKFSQQASLGIKYEHPCWKITLEAYRINRPSGTSTASNFGVNFLLEFNGLGSVGQYSGR